LGMAAIGNLTADQLGNFTSKSCSGFNGNMFYMNGESCSKMSLDCATNITVENFINVNAKCVGNMTDNVFSNVGKERILNLGCMGYGGINGTKFAKVLINLGPGYIDEVSYKKLVMVKQEAISGLFKLWGTHDNLKEQSTRSACDGKHITWLSVAYSKNESASCLTNYTVFADSLKNYTNFFTGLRQGHASHVPSDFFKTSPNLQFFSESFISGMSADQIKNVPCGAFRGFFNGMKSLEKKSVLSVVSGKQLSGMFNDTTIGSSWNCSEPFRSMTSEQSSYYSSHNCQILSHCSSYKSMFDACPSHEPAHEPAFELDDQGGIDTKDAMFCDVPEVYNSIIYAETCTDDSSSTTNGGLSGGAIAGIVIAVIVVIGLVIGVVYYCNRSKQGNDYARV